MSLNGEKSFQSVYKTLSSHICQLNLTQVCSNEFALLNSNAARVEYLLNLQGVKELLRSPSSKLGKNSSEAMTLKNLGNKYFQKKNPAQALLLYNRAVRQAPVLDNSELLALCFANRSAALYSMKKYKECLADIELAINHGYPNEMLYKLLSRRAKCQQYCAADSTVFVASVQQASESLSFSNLDQAGQDMWQEDISKLMLEDSSNSPSNLISSVPSREVTNQKYPALSDCASVYESNEFGRYIRADADISAGEIVLVESPYCSVTLSESYLMHCCHCQRRVDLLYPCRSCANVIFCGIDCENSSWTQYHRYECEHIQNIKCVDINMGHLALRSALQSGYKTLSYILKGDFEKLGSCDYYDNIYNLQGHEDDRPSKDLFWRTAAAIVLAQQCDTEMWSKSADDAVFILATFILHHMQTFPCNAHEISETAYDEKNPSQSVLEEVGAGIYATLSLFNHSCDPSVVRTFQDGNKCVMKSLSPIRKSEQIYDNYGCLHATHTKNDRQDKLYSQYYFQCCCAACMQDWCLYNGLSYNDTPLYKCGSCGTMIVPPFAGACDQCETLFNKSSIDGQLSEAKKEFDGILNTLFTTNYNDYDITANINKLKTYSELVNSFVFRPYKTLNDCQEALKHLYSLQGNVVLKSENS